MAGTDPASEREWQGVSLEWSAGQEFERSVICAKEIVLHWEVERIPE